ncbi:21 kDa protein [Linum perenne]
MSSAATAAVILLILSTTAARPISPSAAATNFIRTSCTATTYPDLCFTSLSTHAAKIQSSPKLLAATSLHVTLTAAKSTSATISTLSRAHVGLTPREAAAMKDCVEELRRSIDEMEDSKMAFEMMISDVQTWVSAALTDESTCVDGFSGEVREVVRGKVERVVHLTSNGLALVNRYADSVRE